ncbi:hypothetical protein B0I22_0247 [Epilithonimonas xixisoli]|uniref:SnoaL-like protein n=2 Tax=Epilithonimonas xixisoli TaxID=1476462 RepID=A0A4R8IHY4_9FLAO|nr:hypothetical protein B0I22_0247 [Epilithonimonas xixisoli]
MKNKFIIILTVFCLLTACGQKKIEQNKPIKTKKKQIMDLNKITNQTVKKAIEALQENDKTNWYSYFTKDAVFTDDGNQLNLKSFFDNAFNHKEKFLSIDKVENEGKNLEGNFFAGQWGTFRTYFNFHINEEGKIERLDIGQAK